MTKYPSMAEASKHYFSRTFPLLTQGAKHALKDGRWQVTDAGQPVLIGEGVMIWFKYNSAGHIHARATYPKAESHE